MSQNEPKWADLLPPALHSAPLSHRFRCRPSCLLQQPCTARVLRGDAVLVAQKHSSLSRGSPWTLITTQEPHKFTSSDTVHNCCNKLHKYHVSWPILLSSDLGQQSRDRFPCYKKLARTAACSSKWPKHAIHSAGRASLQLQEFSGISLHILPDRDLWSIYVLKQWLTQWGHA